MPLLPYISAGLGHEYLYRLYFYQKKRPLELRGSCFCASRSDTYSWSHDVKRSSRTVSVAEDPVLNLATYTFTDTSEC